MPWCPKCKNEYYEGFTVCADCGENLVDSLDQTEEKKQKTTFLTEEDLRHMREFSDGLEDPETAQDILDEIDDMVQEAETPQFHKGTYRNYAERAEDNKSSAVTLLLIGGAGLVVLVLCAMQIIPGPVFGSGSYMIYGVMGAMFLGFFVMGIVSAMNAGKYGKKAVEEAELTAKIKDYCLNDLSPALIDENLFTEDEKDMSDEQKYFKRFERLKDLIIEQFSGLDDGYLNRFVDEIFHEIFVENE